MSLTSRFALLFWCFYSSALAQPNTCTVHNPTNDCEDACITCGFGGAGGGNFYQALSPAPGFCDVINNNLWFGFLAGTSTATFTLTPSNCAIGTGLQMALYPDCSSSPIACNPGNGTTQPVQLQNVSLVIGQIYYLMVDGYNGDGCNFTLSVSPPMPPPTVGATGPIVGTAKVCADATATYSIAPAPRAHFYHWTIPPGATLNGIAGPGPIVLDAAQGTSVQIKFGNTGGNISVYGSNICNAKGSTQSRAVSVGPIPTTNLPPVSICNDQLPYFLPWGEEAAKPGIYTHSYRTPLGCDSTITLRLNVLTPTIKSIGNFVVCEGESVNICGQIFENPGTHTVICPNATGNECDTTLLFSIVRPSAVILGGGSLNCFNGAVPIWAGNQTGKKVWKNSNGQVVGTGDSLVVTQAGRYFLEVTEIISGKNCISQQSIEIKAVDTLKLAVLPNITPITCAKPLTTVGFVTNMPASITWQGVTGTAALTHNVPVGTPGSFVFSAGTPGGCKADMVVNVPGNLTPPAVTALGDTISCKKTSATIGVVSPIPGVDYSWTGIAGTPGINQPQLQVTTPGVYTVVAVNPSNGCSNSATATVFDFRAPTVSVKGNTIYCPNTTLTLELVLTGNLSNLSVAWQGPNNFTANLAEPTVSAQGVYTVTVTNSVSACTNTASVNVTRNVSGFAMPPVVGGTLTCANPAIQLQVPGLLGNHTYQWIGPNGFSSALATPTVSVAGTYSVSVTNVSNGCKGIGNTVVGSNVVPPTAQAIGGTLPCKTPTLTLNCVTNATNATFQWSGPNGFSAAVRNPVVNEQGSYRVTVTNNDGCTKTATATVQPHVAAPYVFLSVVTTAGQRRLNCSTFATNPTYAWTGPNNFTANIANPVITAAGTYTVLVTDGSALGCQTYKSIAVPALLSTGHHGGEESKQIVEHFAGIWHIFPNPAANVVWLRFEGEHMPAETSVRLLDATGRLVLEQQVNPAEGAQIDLEGVASGVYQILLSSDRATEAKRLVVERL